MKNITLFILINSCLIGWAQDFNHYTINLEQEKIEIPLVAVTGGTFEMGSNDANRPQDEKPLHQVTVDDFWIGKYEITWQQYEAFVQYTFNENGLAPKDQLEKLGINSVSGATMPYVEMSFGMGKENRPAVNITQYAALMYCKWLTAKTGQFYRLPTEAEWEYACKQGKTDQGNLNDMAWYDENTNDQYEEIGIKQANTLGIHDMLGNVAEWVMDQYDANYYAKSEKNNPWLKPTKLYPRVVRGGSWKTTASKICCSSRQKSISNWKRRDPQIPKSKWWLTNAPFVGFRIVRPKTQPNKNQIQQYWLHAIDDFGLD